MSFPMHFVKAGLRWAAPTSSCPHLGMRLMPGLAGRGNPALGERVVLAQPPDKNEVTAGALPPYGRK